MRRRLSQDRRGITALEFGLIGPVLIMMMIMMFELGLQLLTGAMLDYSVRMAARFGVTGEEAPDGSTREGYIRKLILESGGGFLKTGNLTLTLSGFGGWPAAASGTGGTPGAGQSGGIVSYNVIYKAPLLTLPGTSLLGAEIIHRNTVMVANEPFPIK